MYRTALVLLAIALFSCKGCKDEESAAGGECDPGDAEACPEGLQCSADSEGTNRCLIPIKASCDIEAEEDFCAGDASCVETEDDPDEVPARCLVETSGECEDADECAPGLACEATGTAQRCWAPVVIRGRVFDSESDEGIEGAQVIALNDEATAISDIGISGEDGAYELPVPIERNEDGEPLDEILTLRASAQDYLTFPGGIRTSLPIDASDAAAEDDGPWVIQNPVTDIALIILPDDQQGRPSISGFISSDVRKDGVLVVAEAGGVGYSAVSAISGDFTIFNVPQGTHEVRGYAAGVQLTPVDVEVADEDVTDVELADAGDTTVTVDGSIQLVDNGEPTSVVLVVESTFQANFGRGEVPSGLRAPKTGPGNISGSWSIEGVPEGRYVVLAAFENDESVRDPDQAIAGTSDVIISVSSGQDQTVGESFKVTEALDVISPGRDEPEGVASAPTLRWEDDSSEKFYEVRVYNAYGDEVWNDLMVPEVSGAGEVSVQYGGPFEDGMYYQFRATSFREPGGMVTPISTTEDLRGVFFKE